jgi:hypothetical protein
MFVCKTSFIDDEGKVHNFGKRITDEEFLKLTSQQQRKYVRSQKQSSKRALVGR